VNHLLERGAAVNRRNDEGLSALHVAVLGHHVGIIELLIAHGADVNVKDDHRQTPLHVAVQTEDEEQTLPIVRTLLEHGADPNSATPDEGVTPVHIAIDSGNSAILQTLLEAGADPNLPTAQRQSPLHLAIDMEQADMVEMLCEAGADLNAKDNDGNTPLDLAKTIAGEPPPRSETGFAILRILAQYQRR